MLHEICEANLILVWSERALKKSMKRSPALLRHQNVVNLADKAWNSGIPCRSSSRKPHKNTKSLRCWHSVDWLDKEAWNCIWNWYEFICLLRSQLNESEGGWNFTFTLHCFSIHSRNQFTRFQIIDYSDRERGLNMMISCRFGGDFLLILSWLTWKQVVVMKTTTQWVVLNDNFYVIRSDQIWFSNCFYWR